MTPSPEALFRLVNTNPPSEYDFLSNQAKGRPPRGPELHRPDLYSSISMFGTFEAAAAQAQRPGYVARLEIPSHDDVRVEQTLGPDHFSVWGNPTLLLTFVRTIHPLTFAAWLRPSPTG